MTKFLDWFPVWFFTNTLVMAIFIMGNETEYTFFAAGVAFIAWTMLFTSGLLFFSAILTYALGDDFNPEDNSVLKDLYHKYGTRGSLFARMDIVYDAVMFGVMWHYDWYITAIVYGIAVFNQQIFYAAAKDYCEKEQKCSV